MKFIMFLALLLGLNTVHARTDLSTPEYRPVVDIVSLPGFKLTKTHVDQMLNYALMETDSVWENNIFGMIRHGLNKADIKYNVLRYLGEQLLDIYFHKTRVFSFQGQHFTLTQNTKELSHKSFWDLAESLEAKHIFDMIQEKMFDVAMLSTANKGSLEIVLAEEFLKQISVFIKKNLKMPHLDYFALSIKHHIFNIYAGSDSPKVKIAAYEIITAIIKNKNHEHVGKNPVSIEFRRSLDEISRAMSFLSCRNMWN